MRFPFYIAASVRSKASCKCMTLASLHVPCSSAMTYSTLPSLHVHCTEVKTLGPLLPRATTIVYTDGY